MKRIRLLLIEDNEDDALLTINHLKENGYELFYKIVFTHEDLKALLTNEIWDCIISDYAMPNFTGLDALDEFLKHNLDIPFILLSGTMGETLAVKAMKMGASDYIMKNHLALLGSALDRELREAETLRQNKQKDIQIRADEKLLRKKNIEIELQNEELRQINDDMLLSMHQIKESETKFRAITNMSLDGICLVDLDGNFLFVNPMFCIITGFTSIELLNMTTYNLNSPSLLKLFLTNDETIAGKYLETVILRKDGINVITEVIGNIISIDNQPLVIGKIRDITERKRIEKALFESERFSRATLDALSSSIAVLNEQGEIIFENKAWRAIGADNSLIPSEKQKRYNYLNICDLVPLESEDYEYAKASADGIRAVIRDEMQIFQLEYPCDSTTEKRWFHLQVTRFDGEGPVYVTVSHEDISERKKGEISLLQSEKRFSKIFDSSPVGISLMEPITGLIFDANNAFAAIMGYSREDIIGRTTIELNFWADLNERKAAYSLMAKDGRIVNKTIESKKKNGEKLFLQFSLEPIELSGKNFILSNTLDITKRIEIENEVKLLTETLESKVDARTTELADTNEKLIIEIDERKKANKKFELVVESIPFSILLVDSNGFIQFTNSLTENYFGYKIEELIGQRIEKLVPNENALEHGDLRLEYMLEPVARSMKAYPIVYGMRKDGSKIPLEVGLNPIKINGDTFILTSILDITERIKMEETQKQSAFRLELATRAGGVGLWEYDIVNNRIVWDEQMYVLYGTTKEKFGGVYEAWQSGLHADDAENADAEMQMAISGKKEFDTEFRVVWSDGSIHHIRGLAKVLRDKAEKPLSIIGTNWDITEQKNSEQALRNNQAKLSAIINAFPDMIFTLNKEGVFIDFYIPVFDEAYALPQDFIGKKISNVMPADWVEVFQTVLEKVLASQQMQIFEYSLTI